eukprot:2946030-Rhodomonas_salina.1
MIPWTDMQYAAIRKLLLTPETASASAVGQILLVRQCPALRHPPDLLQRRAERLLSALIFLPRGAPNQIQKKYRAPKSKLTNHRAGASRTTRAGFAPPTPPQYQPPPTTTRKSHAKQPTVQSVLSQVRSVFAFDSGAHAGATRYLAPSACASAAAAGSTMLHVSTGHRIARA